MPVPSLRLAGSSSFGPVVDHVDSQICERSAFTSELQDKGKAIERRAENQKKQSPACSLAPRYSDGLV